MLEYANDSETLPGEHLDISKMPGHWLLARMGKRVLRPGGLELTKEMLEGLQITPEDKVVELAPGLGSTARLALAAHPASYTGIERDEAATSAVEAILLRPEYSCKNGTASKTGLDQDSATVVYGEAMLTMQTLAQKEAIVEEAFRILQPGGRYGIHELGLTPDTLSTALKEEVKKSLSAAIRVGARPLTISEWKEVLEKQGFEIEVQKTAPMHLLEPSRMLKDEGFPRTLKILSNVLRTPTARKRIFSMRAVFQKYQDILCAVSLVARKPEKGR